MYLKASPNTDDAILLTHLQNYYLWKQEYGGDWPGEEKYIT